MSDERIKEIEAYADKMALLQNKSFEERKMAKVIKELLGAVKSKAVNNEAEYKRGYDAGVHDERDRAYEAKKAAKAKPVTPEPEEEQPFAEVEV